MVLTERGNRIVSTFSNYMKTGNKSLIVDFSREDLVATLSEFRLDKGQIWYKAIEDRVAEIDEESKYLRSKKDKWKDRIITFILGLISGLILIWIAN